MASRVRNPIVQSNTKDRTGTGSILRRALTEIDRRFSGLQVDVLAVFARIPVYALNEATMAEVLYGMTPDEMAATSQALQAALERWIASGRESAHAMWWAAYDEEASQLGAAQTAANLTNLAPAYAASRNLETIVYSTAYRNRVSMAQLKSYEHWTGLRAGMRSELSQVIGRAVVDGKSPRAVEREIMDRLDVGRAKARQYAQTDITDTLRQARMAEAEYATESLGLKIGLLWTSALIPTTRPWHASRNGKVYSAAEVREFYAVNGNRYRCHCATTECLLDTAGKPILTDSLKQKMLAEKGAWERSAKEKFPP